MKSTGAKDCSTLEKEREYSNFCILQCLDYQMCSPQNRDQVRPLQDRLAFLRLICPYPHIFLVFLQARCPQMPLHYQHATRCCPRLKTRPPLYLRLLVGSSPSKGQIKTASEFCIWRNPVWKKADPTARMFCTLSNQRIFLFYSGTRSRAAHALSQLSTHRCKQASSYSAKQPHSAELRSRCKTSATESLVSDHNTSCLNR
mmetsp:Transcript_19645/g.32425  ORF Transcript_19645/g.32425 Transcript_19645/m.32425 type:complete len:201 (+) Transcript_19645:860-1462(+)